MSFSHATEAQREEIKRIGGQVFSQTKKTQPPPTQPAQTPPETVPKAPQSKKLGLGDPMLRIAAKIYLKGFYEGQIHTKETPPSIDDIVKITKEEMGLT